VEFSLIASISLASSTIQPEVTATTLANSLDLLEQLGSATNVVLVELLQQGRFIGFSLSSNG
jgi:hypothetical protein